MAFMEDANMLAPKTSSTTRTLLQFGLFFRRLAEIASDRDATESSEV